MGLRATSASAAFLGMPSSAPTSASTSAALLVVRNPG